MAEYDTGLRSAVEEIRGNTSRIALVCARIDQRLKDHIDQQDIHTRPPCAFQQQIDRRIWAGLVAAVGALVAALWGLVR